MVDKKQDTFVTSNLQDYALITLMKTIRKIELLDEKRNNTDEITKLRHFIGIFVHKTLNSESVSEESLALIDRYPEILEIADQKDEVKANELTKSLLQKYRKELLSSVKDYKKISEGECEKVMLNASAFYAQIFKPEIEAHNASRRNKDNQINKEEFIKSLMLGEINDDTAKIVLKSKEAIMEKIKNRQFSAKPEERLFQAQINDILPGLTIDYSIKGNTSAVQQANRKVRSYFSAADALSYRKDYPDDETARRVAPGSKEDFLKLLGSLAQAGYSQIQKGIEPNERSLSESFNTFKTIIAKNYADANNEEFINKVLGVGQGLAPEKQKAAQLAAFAEKGASVYTQMLGGFIQIRRDTFPSEKINISNIISALKKYIDGMTDGKQDIKAMDMLMPDQDNTMLSISQEKKRGQEIKKEQAGKQHVNVDHINPVASAITLYLTAHPEEIGEKVPDINLLKKGKLLELVEKAAPLVDNIANHRQVIGNKVNDALDAKGSYILGGKRDNSIIACSYSAAKVIELIRVADENIDKSRYIAAFEKYSKADSRGIITTALDLPEHPDVAKVRETYAPRKNTLDFRMVLDNISIKE